MTTRDPHRWGPFSPDALEPGERLARTRALRAIVRLLLGPRGAELAGELEAAERSGILDRAHAALERLAALDLRRVLASYGALAHGSAV